MNSRRSFGTSRSLAFFITALFLGQAMPGHPLAAPGEAAAPSRAGHWEGAIETPGTKLAINIDLSRKDGGAWIGDITISMQGAQDLPLANILIEGAGISFDLPGVPGSPSFKGKLAEDGTKISGGFTQGGQTLAFSLERGESREAEAGVWPTWSRTAISGRSSTTRTSCSSPRATSLKS